MKTVTLPPPETQPIEDAIRRVLDPEFGISVWDLGLIYSVTIEETSIQIIMTLTSPYCPAGDVIMEGVRTAAAAEAGGLPVEVTLAWDPPWSPDLISATGRDQLGWK